MFSCTPDRRNLRMLAPSRSGDESTIRWPTIRRSTRRAIGTTTSGNAGATPPPTLTAARIHHGKNRGVRRDNLRSSRAATALSCGRITPSTNPTVKAKPSASLMTSASIFAERAGCSAAARASQSRTREIDCCARRASAGLRPANRSSTCSLDTEIDTSTPFQDSYAAASLVTGWPLRGFGIAARGRRSR